MTTKESERRASAITRSATAGRRCTCASSRAQAPPGRQARGSKAAGSSRRPARSSASRRGPATAALRHPFGLTGLRVTVSGEGAIREECVAQHHRKLPAAGRRSRGHVQPRDLHGKPVAGHLALSRSQRAYRQPLHRCGAVLSRRDGPDRGAQIRAARGAAAPLRRQLGAGHLPARDGLRRRQDPYADRADPFGPARQRTRRGRRTSLRRHAAAGARRMRRRRGGRRRTAGASARRDRSRSPTPSGARSRSRSAARRSTRRSAKTRPRRQPPARPISRPFSRAARRSSCSTSWRNMRLGSKPLAPTGRNSSPPFCSPCTAMPAPIAGSSSS